MNRLTLKWGTIKAWDFQDGPGLKDLKKWHKGGVSMSAALQKDTPEQKQAILEVIDNADEIWLDWEDKEMTREEAKQYILNYNHD